VVQATVELLAVCFAASIDAASFLAYIRTQIVKYLAEQQRFFAKGQGVCLVRRGPGLPTITGGLLERLMGLCRC
jgi:hypothetical protein